MCWTRCKCGTHHFLLVDKIYHVSSGEFLREKMVSYGVNLNERTKLIPLISRKNRRKPLNPTFRPAN